MKVDTEPVGADKGHFRLLGHEISEEGDDHAIMGASKTSGAGVEARRGGRIFEIKKGGGSHCKPAFILTIVSKEQHGAGRIEAYQARGAMKLAIRLAKIEVDGEVVVVGSVGDKCGETAFSRDSEAVIETMTEHPAEEVVRLWIQGILWVYINVKAFPKGTCSRVPLLL